MMWLFVALAIALVVALNLLWTTAKQRRERPFMPAAFSSLPHEHTNALATTLEAQVITDSLGDAPQHTVELEDTRVSLKYRPTREASRWRFHVEMVIHPSDSPSWLWVETNHHRVTAYMGGTRFEDSNPEEINEIAQRHITGSSDLWTLRHLQDDRVVYTHDVDITSPVDHEALIKEAAGHVRQLLALKSDAAETLVEHCAELLKPLSITSRVKQRAFLYVLAHLNRNHPHRDEHAQLLARVIDSDFNAPPSPDRRARPSSARRHAGPRVVRALGRIRRA